MKLRTFTFLKHKTHLFSFTALVLGGIFFTRPAYSQADYFYGLNKTGVRIGLGVGASMLQSNWSSSPISLSGAFSLDYDLSPYFSIGLQGQGGQLSGVDAEHKLYFEKTAVTFAGGNLNLKVAIGQFANFKTHTLFQDVVKRIYLGVGVGEVWAQAKLYKYTTTPKPGIQKLEDANGYAATYPNFKVSEADFKSPSGTSLYIPISFGTNIALRGLGGNDKFELNPNFQYNMVQTPYFDGYQPNYKDPANIPGANPKLKISGNQAFFLGTINLRYKF